MQERMELDEEPAASPTASSNAELQAAFARIYERIRTQIKSASATAATSPSSSSSALSSVAPPLTPASLESAFDVLFSSLTSSKQLALESEVRAAHAKHELDELSSFVTRQILPSTQQKFAHLQATFSDPGLNTHLVALQAKHQASEEAHAKREQELHATTFHADSLTGRKLLARAQRLMQENQEFDTTLHKKGGLLYHAQKKITDLEASHQEEVHKSEELDAALKEAIELVNELEKENALFKKEVKSVKKEMAQLKAQQTAQQAMNPPALPSTSQQQQNPSTSDTTPSASAAVSSAAASEAAPTVAEPMQ